MELARREDRALLAAVRDKGYTPRRADVDALVALLAVADDDTADDVQRALLAHPEETLDRAMERFSGSRPPMRSRVVRLVGRLGGTSSLASRAGDVGAWLLGRLDDEDPKTRRHAAQALPRWGVRGAEEALLAAWEKESRVEHRVTIAQSLGKVGGVRARSLLRSVASSDARLQKAIEQAALMVERTLHRGVDGTVEMSGTPRAAATMELGCKRGLEKLLASEFDASWGATVIGPGRVRVMLSGPLETIYRARIFRTAAFVVPPVPKLPGADVADAVVASVLSPGSMRLFESFMLRTVRYRLEWAEGGHRKALTWKCVSRISELCPALVNDPRDSAWDIIVHESADRVQVHLRPRKMVDPRFSYRRAEVPAASHPTIAAALARVAGASADDVVWDPFVGSGLELAERARLGAYARMEGRDLDAVALAAAQKNLGHVSRLSLVQGDALDPAPAGVSLILTNPPLGHRVGFGRELPAMLERFVAHAARALVPGGRMVWLSPMDRAVREAGERAGLRLTMRQRVDLGGLEAELQRLERPLRG